MKNLRCEKVAHLNLVHASVHLKSEISESSDTGETPQNQDV